MKNNTAAQAWKEHAGRMVGRKITGLCIDPGHELGPLFGFDLDDGTTVWVLADPEGNGGGFLGFEDESKPQRRRTKRKGT